MMQMDADILGVDIQHAIIVHEGAADVRLHGQVGLSLEIIFTFHRMGSLGHQRGGLFALFNGDLIVDIGGAGMNLDGTVGHGRRGAQVSRQLL